MDEHGIPAANIRNLDLRAVAQRFPDAANEIAVLGELMQRGAETSEEFRRLCELLHEVGETKEAEYLLRRNIMEENDKLLYLRLFGTAVPDIYSRAIASFAEEFGLELTLNTELGFLDREYRSAPLNDGTPHFNTLDNPCIIRFDYSDRDFVVANVIDARANEAEKVNCFNLNTNIFFRWQSEGWRLIDPRDACR